MSDSFNGFLYSSLRFRLIVVAFPLIKKVQGNVSATNTHSFFIFKFYFIILLELNLFVVSTFLFLSSHDRRRG